MPAPDSPPRLETTPLPGAPAPRERFGLPDQRTLVGWLFVFRVVLATLLLVRAAYIWPQIGSDSLFISIVILLALAATAYGVLLLQNRSGRPGPLSFLTQALADLAVVTALVRVGGEASTVVAALYVLVIATYALLLPAWAGVLVAAGAGASYLGAQLLTGGEELPAGLWGQLVVFGFVFVLVGLLAERLQRQVTVQRQMVSELSRVRFEAGEILRSIKTGVITVDGAGTLAFANPAAERLLLLSMQADAGQPILERLQRLSPELHDAVVAGILRSERVVRGEGTVTRPDGRRFPIGLSTTTFEQAGGGLPAVTALFTDLSEMKQLQELNLRAERLEAVAALSASLAHEIRNPLASIRSSVEQLAGTATADEDERTLGRLIMRESDRLSRPLRRDLDQRNPGRRGPADHRHGPRPDAAQAGRNGPQGKQGTPDQTGKTGVAGYHGCRDCPRDQQSGPRHRVLHGRPEDECRVREEIPERAEKMSEGGGGDLYAKRDNLMDLVVELNLDLVLEDIEDIAERNIESVNRISMIIKSTKRMSHFEDDFTDTDLNTVVIDAVTLTHNQVKYDMTVQLDLAANLPTFKGMPQELGQVFINLIINARDAMREKELTKNL